MSKLAVAIAIFLSVNFLKGNEEVLAEQRSHRGPVLLSCHIEFADFPYFDVYGRDKSLSFSVNLSEASRQSPLYLAFLRVKAEDVTGASFEGQLSAYVSNVPGYVGNVGVPVPGENNFGPLNIGHLAVVIDHSAEGKIVSYAQTYMPIGQDFRVEGYSGRSGIADYAVQCEPVKPLRRVPYR